MASVNPYRAPSAAVADAAEQFQPVSIFSTSGRIGRVRYIAYSVGLPFLIMLVFGFAGGFIGTAANAPMAAAVLMGIGYLLTFVLIFMLTIQRTHDFDTDGWLSLVVLIPLVNLIFWFIPGTEGENRFGAKTPPNSTLAVIFALIVPIIVIVGILAAVSIPAYQDYTKRAQQKMQKK
ncbi:MAG TPA: DUF805 domain-containing protein [Burkholderiales bacterium]